MKHAVCYRINTNAINKTTLLAQDLPNTSLAMCAELSTQSLFRSALFARSSFKELCFSPSNSDFAVKRAIFSVLSQYVAAPSDASIVALFAPPLIVNNTRREPTHASWPARRVSGEIRLVVDHDS